MFKLSEWFGAKRRKERKAAEKKAAERKRRENRERAASALAEIHEKIAVFEPNYDALTRKLGILEKQLLAVRSELGKQRPDARKLRQARDFIKAFMGDAKMLQARALEIKLQCKIAIKNAPELAKMAEMQQNMAAVETVIRALKEAESPATKETLKIIEKELRKQGLQ